MSEWRYYLPDQDPNGEDPISLDTQRVFGWTDLIAQEAFEDYWSNHDGWELGVDQDYELVLIAPDGKRTRWSVRAEQSVQFSATGADS